MKRINNKGYVLTEILVVTVVVIVAFLAIYVNYYPMLGEYERRTEYTNLEPKYSLFYMKRLYLTSYQNGEEILEEFRANDNLKYIDLLKTEGNKLVCKSEYVDDVELCNSLVEQHGIKRLIVTEYNIDDVKNISIEKNFDKYIDYLPNYKYTNDKRLFRLTIETEDGYATTEFDLLKLRRLLYGVLEDAAYEGTYAKKYTGSHQDSMDSNQSIKNIYYWYGSNATNGTAILDKNNVIFANHCWQMIRTTDTGGVRMIYNGEVVDGKCLNTRGTHVGYGGKVSRQSLKGTYWYGTEYTYDSSTKKFSLSGAHTTSFVEITSSNGSTVIPTLVGKYTCKSGSPTGTCSTLYLVESYDISYNANVISLNSNSNYSQFGTLQFNANSDSPAYVGYMYNKVYPTGVYENAYRIIDIPSAAIRTSWYYSDAISYDSTTNTYTLTNPQLISSLSDVSELNGKYILSTGGDASAPEAKYIVGDTSNLSSVHYKTLSGGDLATSMMIGDSYIDNGNGTYTIKNAISVSYIDWYNSSSTVLNTYKKKYLCLGTNETCNNLMRIGPYWVTSSSFDYSATDNTYQYSENVTYSNGVYTLTGDIKSFWDLMDDTNISYLSNHHYTCLSNSNKCEKVNYINYSSISYLYYVQLMDGKGIDVALREMLSANNVNAKNSTIKFGVDAWYKEYLLSYDSYIDDTVYCNDRSIKSLGGFNPNGGTVDSYLKFKGNSVESDLSCTNVADKFSISNASAQLTYKVGLMSVQEMNLLNHNNARKTGQTYFLLSPNLYGGSFYNFYALDSGGLTSDHIHSGVRPAISLIPGTRYTSGDGSMANPYVVLVDE